MPSPRHLAPPAGLSSLDARLGPRSVRVVGLALAAVTATGGLSAASHAPSSQPVRASVQLASDDVTTRVAPAAATATPTATRAPAPRRTVPAKQTARAVAKTAKKAPPAKRWLPTGTGMWLHDYTASEGGSGAAIVARAKAVGLSTLYVQTGSSKKGWIGTPTLRSLLPATKGTGIKVVAWDFPKLVHPVEDARRMARAATFHCGGCPRVAAVAPDVETPAEGTRLDDRRVAQYYAALRRALPRDVAVLATVPWPSEKRVGRYPYARTAANADALVPMAYWYNRDSAQVTAASMAYLSRFHKPVMPVGQGYDGRLDAPYLARDTDPFGSVQAFLLQAKKRGATHVSLWSWQTTGGQQWAALARARKLF